MSVGSPRKKAVKDDSAADFAAFQERFTGGPANAHQYNASAALMRTRFDVKSDIFAVGKPLNYGSAKPPAIR
jgi:hypothetical protein